MGVDEIVANSMAYTAFVEAVAATSAVGVKIKFTMKKSAIGLLKQKIASGGLGSVGNLGEPPADAFQEAPKQTSLASPPVQPPQPGPKVRVSSLVSGILSSVMSSVLTRAMHHLTNQPTGM